MLARSLRVTTIAGIDVRIDPSLVVFAVLVAWIFGARFLEQHALATAATMALTATVLFLVSLLVHELAHGLEARYRDIEVHAVTLFFFGGMTEMHTPARRPGDEFAISAVGPYASLVCGAVFGLATVLAPLLGGGLEPAVADVAGLLAWLNVFLAVFNLVPGAPLDGGRVLRAGLWWLLDDRSRAVRISGRAGQLLAAALVLAGAWMALRVAGSLVFGLVLIMVGVFIFQAARIELSHGQVDRLLHERDVGELLDEPSPALEVDRPLDLADPGPGERLLPVVDGRVLVGVLPPARVRDLHPADRTARTAGELMDPVDGLPEVDRRAPLREVVDLLVGDAELVAVRDEQGVLAVLREADVARGLHGLRRRGRGLRRAPRAPREQAGR